MDRRHLLKAAMSIMSLRALRPAVAALCPASRIVGAVLSRRVRRIRGVDDSSGEGRVFVALARCAARSYGPDPIQALPLSVTLRLRAKLIVPA
jgi:hypothetical protein